jgi:hypothetical protein
MFFLCDGLKPQAGMPLYLKTQKARVIINSGVNSAGFLIPGF